MAIRRVEIENYRSIDYLDISFESLNALVGSNNAGKSNILRALNIVLGEAWPSRPFTDEDYHNHDLARTIYITVIFTAPLACDPTVQGFTLSCAAHQPPDYFAVDANGNILSWPNGSNKRVSNVMRDEVALLYLGLDRECEKQLRASQWTLYGKLLKRIENAIGVPAKTAFGADVQRSFGTNVRPQLTRAETIIDDIVRKQTGLNIRLEFRVFDALDVLRNVRPQVIEGGLTVDPEEAGAGVQSALAVAIARAYSEIVRNPVVLAIEEPELYLHPHGCRHFYRLLKEFSQGGLQIIYTTHERSFVNVGDFSNVHIVRKPAGVTEVTSGRSLAIAGAQQLRLQSKFNERINEVFFASAVVLTEGDPDEIACRSALEALGIDLDKRSISVISVGGQAELPAFAELLSGMDIPTFVLNDEDPGNAATAATRARVLAHIPAGRLFLQAPNLENLWRLARKPNKVEAMTTFPTAAATPANIPQVYRDLLAAL